MPIPPECQAIQAKIDEKEALKREYQQNLQEAVGGQAKAVWGQKIVALINQITNLKQQLNNCIRQQAPGYVVDIDFQLAPLPTPPVPPTSIARLWRLGKSAGGQVSFVALVESVPLVQRPPQGSPDDPLKFRATFANAGTATGGALIAISISDAQGTAFDGPMFRSVPQAALPGGSAGDPDGRIELLVLTDELFVSLEDLHEAAGELPREEETGIPALGKINLLKVVFTSRAGGAGLDVAIDVEKNGISLRYTFPFTLAPSWNTWCVDEILRVVPLGPGHVQFLTSVPYEHLLSIAVQQMLDAEFPERFQLTLNKGLRQAAIRRLFNVAPGTPLPAVPLDIVISVRRVSTFGNGILLWPAVGAYGGLVEAMASTHQSPPNPCVGGKPKTP